MNPDFNIVVNKISAFKRKYLFHKILKGFLVVLLLSILIFFFLNILEYNLFMPSGWRRILFLTTVLFLTIVAMIYVFFPLLQLVGIIRNLSRKKVTGIIQNSIPEIGDKLLNVLELNDISESVYSVEIINAAISQKIESLRIIDFSGYLTLKNLRNLFFYLVMSFIIIMTIFFVDKSMIMEPGKRIINFNREFSRPAPFKYEILNKSLKVKKGEDFVIKVVCKGTELPSVLYVNIGGSNYLMNNVKDEYFEFGITSVINDIVFFFTDLKYISERYMIEMIPVALVNHFSVEINSPVHTGIGNHRIENIGDIKVAEGSKVRWKFECLDTDSLRIVLKSGINLFAEKDKNGEFVVQHIFMDTEQYRIEVRNENSDYETAMSFTVGIIEDFYPEIKVVQIQDSIVFSRFYFKGTIHDDYGFTRLNFHTNIDERDSVFNLQFIPYLKPQDFYFTFDMNDVGIPGKIISYYFSVTDNDQINGPKSTTSESNIFQIPDKSQIEKKNDEDFKRMEEILSEARNLTRELKNEIKQLQFKNIDQKISEWERTGIINEIVDKKENLEKLLDNLEELNQKKVSYENTFSPKGEDIIKKQEEIRKLLEDVLTDELKKLLEEFSKLAKDFNNQKLNEMGKKTDMSFDNLEKQLNRNLELLKRMKIEQDFERLIERVKEVRKNEEKEADELGNNGELERTKISIDEDIREIEKIKYELHELVKKNEELEEPLILDDFNTEFDDINEKMQETLQELEKKNRRNSSERINETTEELKSLIFAMEQMLKSNRIKENMENIRNIEQILKNVVFLSFEQERLLKDIFKSSATGPELREISRNQKTLIDQSKIVKDSLYALSKRAPQVGNIVNNELLNMELNMGRSTELMGEGLFQQSTTNQQIAITAMNNLALILSDVLKQMNEEQKNMEQGNGNCEKPGGGGNSMSGLKSKSGELKEQLERMIEELKRGGKGMSKQLGESLMEHEMMQQMLRELMEGGMIGPNTRNQLQQIDQLLEQNKRDIINKRVQTPLIQRQNEIMTRLLEAEKSEMERELDNKRESNTADEKFYSNPAKLFRNEKRENISIENLENDVFRLNQFYQFKYKNYVEKFNEAAK